MSARILLTAPHSGAGKTTLTCGIVQALRQRGVSVSAYKCGSDYIDPMFHKSVLGCASHNLDGFLCEENRLRQMFARHAQGADICVVEGVMGYYDGLLQGGITGSSFALARTLDLPAVLIVPTKGMSLSALALLEGFLQFQEDSRIVGVIFNQTNGAVYEMLAEACRTRWGGRVTPLGYLPTLPASCKFESRALGLIPAQEVPRLQESMQSLAEHCEQYLDLDGLLRLAQGASHWTVAPERIPKLSPVRIGIAQDEAFCFYYDDNLRRLEAMGATLCPFSPLTDAQLPPDLDGLYLGGGYPERHAQRLSENLSLRRAIAEARKEDLPTIAEGGGYLYLTQSLEGFPVVGAVSGESYNTHKLTRFGYLHLEAQEDGLLFHKGERIPAHAFHTCDSKPLGTDLSAHKKNGNTWRFGHHTKSLYAGFPQIHFDSRPALAHRFYQACLTYAVGGTVK